jgi:predicted XRE-type DNA-binding protein
MKITHVTPNHRKKAFDIQAGDTNYEFPFAKLRLEPSAEDPVEDVFVDPELGNEAFTYRLWSGKEDTVHLDAVLDAVKDPDYLQDLLLHRLAVEAKKGLEASGLSKRQVARQLGTSPSQLYRLLDPANRRHSIGQMLALLDLVGKEVEVAVRPKPTRTPGEPRK